MSNSQFKVGMLILMENDLEKAVEFYKKLGLVLKFHMKEKWAEFALDEIKIGLCPTQHAPFDRHTGIVLEVKDLNAAKENLIKNGIEFLAEPIEAVHGIMASIKDPGGNVIDIYQPTPEKVQELAKKVAQETAKGGDCTDRGDCDDNSGSACC